MDRIYDPADPDLRAAILDALRHLSPDGITGPTQAEYVKGKPDHLPGRELVGTIFGGYRAALAAAGLVPSYRMPERRNTMRPVQDVDRDLARELGWRPDDAWILHRTEGDANLSGGLTAKEKPGATYYDWSCCATIPGVTHVQECGDHLRVTVRISTVYELI